MKTIRKNTCETNSSITHSLNISLKSDYDKWKKDEVIMTATGDVILY